MIKIKIWIVRNGKTILWAVCEVEAGSEGEIGTALVLTVLKLSGVEDAWWGLAE